MPRLKLQNITYTTRQLFDVFTYSFEGGLEVSKWFVFPFTRLGKPMRLFKMPFTQRYFFTWEIILFVVSAGLIALEVMQVRAMLQMINLPHSSGRKAHEFITLVVTPAIIALTYFIFTVLTSKVLTFYAGTDIKGKVLDVWSHTDEDGYTTYTYRVQLPDGTRITLGGISDAYMVYDPIELVIHPDGVPFVVYNEFTKINLLALVLYVVYAICLGYILVNAVEHGLWR